MITLLVRGDAPAFMLYRKVHPTKHKPFGGCALWNYYKNIK